MAFKLSEDLLEEVVVDTFVLADDTVNLANFVEEDLEGFELLVGDSIILTFLLHELNHAVYLFQVPLVHVVRNAHDVRLEEVF